MMPYLWYVNINGMRREGPKIIPVGQGVLEEKMIRQLIKKGYKGPFGILGHVETADVSHILQNNLYGFYNLKLYQNPQ
jgi:hypothetical protein